MKFPGGSRFHRPTLLGRGGMGTVWSVLDRAAGDRRVALKMLSRRGPSELLALKREFRVARDVHHPGLVRLHELVVDGDRACFTMEQVEGTDLLTWVRQGRPAGQPLDAAGIERARRALFEVSAALHAMHTQGIVHRDVKPGNTRIRPGGRAVLLDLGLARPASADRGQTFDRVAGTPPFMPPEAWRGAWGPPGDLYSLGVTAFVLLTGVLPFRGSQPEVRRQKELWTPEQGPEAFVGPDPVGLHRLTGSLLHPEPARRPTHSEVHRILSVQPEASVLGPGPSRRFLGRTKEVAAVLRGLGEPGLMRVVGPSGVGKTRLIEHALGLWVAQGPKRVVLSSRCHPFESVPFKALDGVIDDLATLLGRMPLTRLRRMRPAGHDALLRLFPVLQRALGSASLRPRRRDLPALADFLDNANLQAASLDLAELVTEGEPADGEADQRTRAFESLRTLLIQFTDATPLVMWIDDTQWGDTDSAALLRELIRGPIPPNVRVVLSSRSHAPSPFDTLELPARWSAQVLQVSRLTTAQASAFVRSRAPELTAPQRAAIVEAGAGLPIQLSELVRARVTGSGSPPRPNALFAHRLALVDAAPRRLVEVVALSGGAIPIRLALTAAGLGLEERGQVSAMCVRGFLRMEVSNGQISIAPLHDKLSESVAALLSRTERDTLHRALHDAWLERPEVDPERPLRHALALEDVPLIRRHARQAVERAEQLLAFERAGDLLEMLIQKGWSESTSRDHQRAADAYRKAGRGSRAGHHYEQCARSAPEATRTSLLRLAAEQYLRSGHLTEGARLIEGVLSAHGVRVPQSRSAALRSAMWHRLRFLLRGTQFRSRSAASVDPADLERIDALWTASTSFAVVDHHLADAMAARHLLDALRVGEPSRVARALGYECCAEGILPGRFFESRALGLGEEAIRIARTTKQTTTIAFATACPGTVHWAKGRWAACARSCEAAIDLFASVRHGVDWQLALNHMYLQSALANMGRLARLEELATRLYSEASTKGDRFAANVSLLGQPAITWLAQDKAEWALQRADNAIAAWGTQTFHTQHYHHLFATVQACLYLGRPDEAHARLHAGWAQLEDGMFLNIELVRCEMWHLRARVACARLRSHPDARAEVERARRTIQKTRLPMTRGFVLQLEGILADAPQDLLLAADHLEAADMDLYAAALRMSVSADPSPLAALGVVAPERLVAVLAPRPPVHQLL